MDTLLCEEDESCLDEQCIYKDESLSDSSSDSEYIEMLIQREAEFQSNGTGWSKCERLGAIKWILDTRALFGFEFSTAYLSVVYFDRFISKRVIDSAKVWAVRLLSVACLSIAAKMEECDIPALSEYHVDEYNFEGNVVQRMELLVLNTLEWKMSCVTPFAYLNYFTVMFCGEFINKELITRAIELILAVMEVINLVEHRPSIIATAAVLAAYDDQLTKELLETKINAVALWGSLEKEHAFYCYSLLQDIGMMKSKTPKSVLSPNLWSTRSSSVDFHDRSSITSTVNTKRRLTYIDGDQHCPPQKIPKPL